MKKVSILSLHLGFGGIEKSVAALANILAEKYEVEIAVTYKLYDEPAFYINPKVKIKYLTKNMKPNRDKVHEALQKKNPVKIVKELRKALDVLHMRKKTMINYIKNSDSDIIIATRDIFDEWLGIYGNSDTVKIGWEHNHFHGNMKYAQNIVSVSKNLDYLVLVSDSLRKFYKKELVNSKVKCEFIPNVIENIPETPSKLTEKRLVSVGRLSHEKGYVDLLKIFNILHNDFPEWTLDIIGDGDEKEVLEDYIKINELGDAVTLHGFRDKEYIDEILNKSSIYLMASYTESFGIVLLEAMSHGLPCVAFSSAEGANELINSGLNGYLIKNRNFNAYIKKVEDLMKSSEDRKKIGKAGLKTVKNYTSDVVGEKWFKLLERK